MSYLLCNKVIAGFLPCSKQSTHTVKTKTEFGDDVVIGYCDKHWDELPEKVRNENDDAII